MVNQLIQSLDCRQVAALPPPDADEALALGQELWALYFNMMDFADTLRAQGCTIEALQQPPTLPQQQLQHPQAVSAAATAAVTANADDAVEPPGQPDETAASPLVHPDHIAAHTVATRNAHEAAGQLENAADSPSMAAELHTLGSEVPDDELCGMDTSLSDIDAVMRARGYR